MREHENILSAGMNAVKEGNVTTRKQVIDLFNEGFKEGLWEAAKEAVIGYGVMIALLMAFFPLYRDKVQFDE